MGENMSKKIWEKPQLVILSKDIAEDGVSVLGICKSRAPNAMTNAALIADGDCAKWDNKLDVCYDCSQYSTS